IEDAVSGSGGLVAARVVEVVVEHDEAFDSEGGEILARDPGPGPDEHRRPPTVQLERLAQHPLELQLVDELGVADEERDRSVALADLSKARMLAADARDVAL